MPKIHRIRIVGLKYDGMQKQYKDTTFNFHNDETSTNGLIAMMNGGGKGVFLQTIFQILKPGTSWGKQNNRYYQQFFFNNKEQFIPYTFHVLIQWELDGADRRHLVTGGMFSAEQRISMSEESGNESKTLEQEAKILPNITFYTREFERKEEAALEHIPLYENGEAAETESLKDYLKWNGGQPLVDASFVAFGLVRCPWLWQNLDTIVKQQVITAFKTTRSTVPVYSNWILFSGMIETFFCKYGLDYDPVRIEYAVREFANHWYIGDGLFSDGMSFHMDYYNSIVIHPYLASIVEIINNKDKAFQWFVPNLKKINQRYAEIQERNINTDGTYPIIGRSIVYRGGVFHHLADIAFKKQLPGSLKPAQVRSALTAVIKKTLEPSGTYNKEGWLSIGLYGPQPGLADFYITTGSLYICSTIFLPLGLPATDEFWSSPAEPWTSVKVWSGENVAADHAVDIR